MKLLIPLTILVISFIIYYLFYEPKVVKKGDFIEVEDIKEITKEDDKKYKNPYKKQNQYAPLIKETKPTPLKVTPPSIKQVEPEEEVIQKDYLTLEDIKEILRIEVRKSILHSGHVSEGHNEIYDSMRKVESLEKVYSREINIRKSLLTNSNEVKESVERSSSSSSKGPLLIILI